MWQVVGQDRAVSLLQRSMEKGLMANAYLFLGPPHVGKTTLALNLAQALNCERAEPPCGECASCRKIASAKHADVQVIGLADNGGTAKTRPRTEIGIDQIRGVQYSSNLPPFEGKYRVFIIDRADLLSTEAANCLLKTLEEVTGRVIFILLAANDGMLPSTVVSRCQRLELSLPAASELEATLADRWGVELTRAKLLSRLCHNCLGWALTAAADDSLLRQRAEVMESLCYVAGADYEERFAYATRLAARFSQDRESVYEVLRLWLDWWRDLLLVRVGNNDGIINVDLEAELVKMAGGYSLAQIRDVINRIREAGQQLGQNANPRLALEVLMLNLPGKSNG